MVRTALALGILPFFSVLLASDLVSPAVLARLGLEISSTPVCLEPQVKILLINRLLIS